MVVSRRGTRAVGLWLLACAAFVLAMVVVGGVTRLTRSGLSIVEWQPITGVLPPLSDDDWRAAFDAYRASPEGRLVNHALEMDGFREIYLVEWTHRLLGRLTGLVVLLPFLFFLATGRLSGKRALRVLGIFALGGLQGFLGWYMVQSGLVDVPHVSPYRLALHLALALVILGLLVWSALDELAPAQSRQLFAVPAAARPFAWGTLLLVALTTVWGAFMAGMHAGHVAPTWPDMNGAMLPDGWYRVVDDAVGVHFFHRTLAYCVAIGTVVTFLSTQMSAAPSAARRAAAALVAFVVVQVGLGVATVLHHVPIALAAVHQLNAALVLCCCVALVHALRRP